MFLSYLFWCTISLFVLRWILENHKFKDESTGERILTNIDIMYLSFYVALYVAIINVLAIGTLQVLQDFFGGTSIGVGSGS